MSPPPQKSIHLHAFDLILDLKVSTVVQSLVVDGRRFHSTVVLGRNDYWKHCLLNDGWLNEVVDDFLVEIPLSGLVCRWSVIMATRWWTVHLDPVQVLKVKFN